LAEDYFNSMKKEVELYRDQLKYNLIDSIFIGGGTPSCVETRYICEILDFCRENLNISEHCEISVESNPGTLDEQKLKEYKSCGINRISIGLQAYQSNLLKYLGRRHSKEDFISSVKIAKKAGFENINADVIFGIPGQTMEDWKETLKALLELEVTHISAYSLKIEEGTRFGDLLKSGDLIPMDDILDREMYHFTIQYLNDNGFNQYELSNFAKADYECKHNLTYWKCADYLGLGAGAHSYLDYIRFSNVYSIEDYIQCLDKGEKPVEERISVDFCDRMSEYMFLGLRLTNGITNKQFQDIFNQNMFEKYKENFKRLQEKKLISIEGDSVRLTNLGLDLANQVFVEFV
jgi:oxygen-independent coproporphyrinogen-3 oxidase